MPSSRIVRKYFPKALNPFALEFLLKQLNDTPLDIYVHIFYGFYYKFVCMVDNHQNDICAIRVCHDDSLVENYKTVELELCNTVKKQLLVDVIQMFLSNKQTVDITIVLFCKQINC